MEKKETLYFIDSKLSSTIRYTIILYTTKKGKKAQDRLIRDPPPHDTGTPRTCTFSEKRNKRPFHTDKDLRAT